MEIIEILRADYARFPAAQTYSIYTPDVYFKDPLNEFRGRDRYEQTIQFIARWFRDVQMELHEIQQVGDRLETEWTLHWTSPLPWQPRIAIPGRSELELDTNHCIASHIDYWHCSRLDVLKQHFFPD
ncbi:MAG: DUF2358 domain-containing protein [Spirulinaceae cyanobacterium SM2_1_0]|nr:DUF2358 domain-containing protein [Spirulinaceae cyanobacterium SM2_1_0]